MKITIETVTATKEAENNEVISRVTLACEGIYRLEEALTSIKERIGNVVFWDFGRGGSHIWISNWKNERLILITE